ncbi:MAG: cytochrome c nitrite reductase small subunit [Bacteroidales bacterium]|nr:cytochrome c nitrite reductase small subunit [Bacteroidales bacterium]
MKIIRKLSPPPSWRLPVILVLGIFFGLGFLTIHISRAPSYLSDKPETCINCHVMYPQYSTWMHSSHRERATCSDCHVPHDNFFRTYYFKAADGARHATIFTARMEPHVIRIKSAGKTAVQENCIRCHIDFVSMTKLVEVTAGSAAKGEGKVCWDCHREVPHGTVNSLAAAPHSLIPRLPSVLPDWLNKYLKNKK